MRCWEFSRYNREAGKGECRKHGSCPASENDAGDACWLVAGSFSTGTLSSLQEKLDKKCTDCAFFKLHSIEQRAEALARYRRRKKDTRFSPVP